MKFLAAMLERQLCLEERFDYYDSLTAYFPSVDYGDPLYFTAFSVAC